MTIEVKAPKGELGKLLVATDMEKPTKADKEKLHDYIAEHGRAELAKIGDLSELTTDRLINRMFNNNYGFTLAVGARYLEIRAELGYDSASTMERLLIDNIVLCWVRLHDVELRYEMLLKNSPTITQADHWERRLTLAQHRYLKAIEALARVRRLLKEPQSPALTILMKQQLGIVNRAK